MYQNSRNHLCFYLLHSRSLREKQQVEIHMRIAREIRAITSGGNVACDHAYDM